MLNMKKIMKQAHKLTKKIIGEYIHQYYNITCTYSEQLGICLRVLIAEERELQAFTQELTDNKKHIESLGKRDWTDYVPDKVITCDIKGLKMELKDEIVSFKTLMANGELYNVGQGYNHIVDYIEIYSNRIEQIATKYKSLCVLYDLNNYLGKFRDFKNRLKATVVAKAGTVEMWFLNDATDYMQYGYKPLDLKNFVREVE